MVLRDREECCDGSRVSFVPIHLIENRLVHRLTYGLSVGLNVGVKVGIIVGKSVGYIAKKTLLSSECNDRAMREVDLLGINDAGETFEMKAQVRIFPIKQNEQHL